MPTVKGRDEVKAFYRNLPREIDTKLLRGAARAMATVVADEAKDRSVSAEVSAAIKVRTRSEDHRMVGLVQVRGPGAYIAPWLEYGTSAHIITVDESQRNGMSIGRINRLAKGEDSNHSMVIGGAFVGDTVLHPGAQSHPFLRPALDIKQGEAIAAGQAFINSRLTRSGIVGAAEPDGDDA